jgi:hypothetical protein
MEWLTKRGVYTTDVGALRTALDADKTGQGLARAQRGAMDYILRKSAKSATSDLPAGVSPEAVDYDLATRTRKALQRCGLFLAMRNTTNLSMI